MAALGVLPGAGPQPGGFVAAVGAPPASEGPHPAVQTHANGKVRKYITVRCDHCRDLHSRCSGHRPTCERCAEKGLQCVYPTVLQKRGPKGRVKLEQPEDGTKPKRPRNRPSGPVRERLVRNPPTLEAIRSNLSELPVTVGPKSSRSGSVTPKVGNIDMDGLGAAFLDEPMLPMRRAESANAASALFVLGAGGYGGQVAGGPQSPHLALPEVVRSASGGIQIALPSDFALGRMRMAALPMSPTAASRTVRSSSLQTMATGLEEHFNGSSSSTLYSAQLGSPYLSSAQLSTTSGSQILTVDSEGLPMPDWTGAGLQTVALPLPAPHMVVQPAAPPIPALVQGMAHWAGSFAGHDAGVPDFFNPVPRQLGPFDALAPLPADPDLSSILLDAVRTIEPSSFDLHLPHFLTYLSATPPSGIDPFLLNALLLRASRLTLRPRSVVRAFLDRVMLLLPDVVLSGNGNVGTVIAMSWCVEHMVEQGEFMKAHQLHGVALALARRLGLQADPVQVGHGGPATADEWISNEERRRTFWRLFAQDSIFVSGMGAPAAIVEEDVAADLPCNDYAWFMAGSNTPAILLPQRINPPSRLVSLAPCSPALRAIPTSFAEGDRRPLFLMLARIQRAVYSTMRRFKGGIVSHEEFLVRIAALEDELRTQYWQRVPAAVRQLDERTIGSRPPSEPGNDAADREWRDGLGAVRFVRFAEGGRENFAAGTFDVEWAVLLWLYHCALFVVRGPEMHSLRCVTDEVRWVDSDDYGSALQCARRITDLALAVELRWAGGGSGPGPQSAGWFPYLAPPANLVTGLYYTASIWLEELRQLVALARGDGRTGASLHYSTRDISNHSALRDLAMACIAAAEKGGEGDADDDAVSVSSKAADPLFPGLSFVPADPAPGSSAAPPAQVPEFVRCRARECVVRFQHHVALLRRIGNHLRTAAGCADALVTLWKADPSMKYVEEVLVR